jgi:beta-lactamase domain protein
VPQFDLHELTGDAPFTVDGIEIAPLPVLHYKLPIIGFRIGALAYITDCKTMPAGTLEKIKGVDTLVINALRHEPHFSHMNLDEAMSVINETAPRQAFLTHLSHDMGLHREVEATLPDNVKIAYDGLTVDVVE